MTIQKEVLSGAVLQQVIVNHTFCIFTICVGYIFSSLVKKILNVAHFDFMLQTFIVEYVVNHQMCDDCHRVEAKDYWKAVVQIRQKV